MINGNRGASEPEIPGTGSPVNGEPVYLVIGRFGKPHGLDGGILFYVITDFPERIKKGRKIFIGEDHQLAYIFSVKDHNRGLILKLKEFKSVDEIEEFSGEYVFVEASELPKLPEGEYYHHQLMGLTVKDTNENILGTITEIIQTGANDVYVIKGIDKKEILYPALKTLINHIDLKNKIMIVKPVEYYNQD